MQFDAVYYEPQALSYPLGKQLQQTLFHLAWYPIENHNRIPQFSSQPNTSFTKLKKHLIIGVRKTHVYRENHKISDYLVPFTSSGCSAMCLYCYLMCHYNKCAYLRLFVNREQMLQKLLRFSHTTDTPKTFEIGSNSDLLLENTVTQNLQWLIPEFGIEGRGSITFPTKFACVQPLLNLPHHGKTIFRMSVNPQQIIRNIEIGTDPLNKRIHAVNEMAQAGYPISVLIAPIILLEGWQTLYQQLLTELAAQLSSFVKKQLRLELIFMTYSSMHRLINTSAFPSLPDLFQPQLMTGRSRGKYGYRKPITQDASRWFIQQIKHFLPQAQICYIC